MSRVSKLLGFGVAIIWYAMRMTLSGRNLTASERDVRISFIQQEAGKSLCSILNVSVSVKGNADFDAPRLIVSNHVGLLDAWILASVFRAAFAAKLEIRSWPVVGWIGKATGLIYVDRDKRMNTSTFVSAVQDRMRNDVGVLVFPEGTTNSGMELLPFKTGGFASVENMPRGVVIPVYIWATKINDIGTNGSQRCLVGWPENENMLQNAWKIVGYRSIEIEVLIGSLISTNGRDRKTLARLAQDQVDHLRRSTIIEASEVV